MSLFSIFKRKTNHKAVFLGLDNAGKSTIISFLKEGRFVEHTPTMGKKRLQFEVSGTRITLMDMGGQKDFRQIWMGELKDAKVVVFVIDKADPERFDEAKAELGKLIPLIQQQGIHLLILANKHDKPNAVDLGSIINIFDLVNLENFEILEISAKTGYGMADAFVKFYSLLTGEHIRKTKFTKAISVFSNAGVPIISRFDPSEKIEREIIEGGFLAAISQFSNMKMACDADEISFISFESEKNGTFLVAKSKNFIGSLLHHEDLNIPIEQSKQALKDLILHLERNCPEADDQENVAFHVEHYITNLI